MTTTLLSAVNDLLRDVGELSSVSPDLTTLTDSARQIQIDKAVKIWQQSIELLQGWADLPQDVGSATISLVTDTREYSLDSSFQGFVGDADGKVYMVCASPSYRVAEYPGGYVQMFRDQPDPSLYTGQSTYFAYNPVTSKVRFDRTPTSAENGHTLTYLFDKALSFSAASDTLPIPDGAVRMLLITAGELYRLKTEEKLTGQVWKLGLTEAIRIAGLKAKSRAYA